MASECGAARTAVLLTLLLLFVGTATAVLLFDGGGPDLLSAEGDPEAAARTAGVVETSPAAKGASSRREESESPEAVPTDEVPAAAAGEGMIPPDATGLAGRVIDWKGRPTAGVAVTVDLAVAKRDAPTFGVAIDGRRGTGRFVRETTTDSDGRFLIHPLPPHDGYRVEARSDDGGIGRVESCEVIDRLLLEIGDVALKRGALVSGVVRSDGGGPIEGARVALGFGFDDRPIRSDAAGRFDVGLVFPGKYRFLVEAAGYALDQGIEYEFVEGDAVDDLELTMVVAAPIHGRVVDDAGRGVAEAQINANRVEPRDPFSWTGGQTRTDADGAFRFDSLPAGTYQVFANKAGYHSANQQAVVAGGPAIELTIQRSGRIEGVVVDATDGGKIRATKVRLLWVARWEADDPNAEFQPYWGNPDPEVAADGSFSIGLNDGGRFIVDAHADGYAPGRSDVIQLEENATISGVVVQLARGMGIDVHVVDAATGEPVPSAVVSVHAALETPESGVDLEQELHILGYSSSFYGEEHSAEGLGERLDRAVTDAAGQARVDSLVAGTVVVVAKHPAFAEARSNSVELRAGGPTPVVELALSHGGAIRGRVTNQHGEAEPALSISANGPQGAPASSVTGEGGAYLIENLTPGRYRVAADIAAGPGAGPLAMIRGQPGRELSEAEQYPIVVIDGETVEHDVTITRIEPGVLKGSVLMNGAPAKGLQVVANLIQANGGVSWTWRYNDRTDELGRFEFRRIDPGSYQLSVRRSWSQTFVGNDVQVAANQETQVTVDIAIGRVVGRVTGQGGAPLADARIQATWKSGATKVSPWGSNRSGASGDDGRFEIDDLQAGTVELKVSRRGYVATTISDLTVSAHRVTGPIDVPMSAGSWIQARIADVPDGGRVHLRFDPEGEGKKSVRRWARAEEGFFWIEIGEDAAGTVTAALHVPNGTPLVAKAPVRLTKGKNVEVSLELAPP